MPCVYVRMKRTNGKKSIVFKQPYQFLLTFFFSLVFLFDFIFIHSDIIVALAGYLDFLSLLLTPLGGNILNLYLQSDVVIDIGRAGLLGTIVMSFPLLTHPARDLFNELILTKSGT